VWCLQMIFVKKKALTSPELEGFFFFSEIAIFIYAIGSSRLQKYSRNS
jgi:hypothetical protein